MVGPLVSNGSKAQRYGCAIYGVPGELRTVSDSFGLWHPKFRTVSLSAGNLIKVQTTVSAVRIYADGELHPADAVQMLIGELQNDADPIPHTSYVRDVQIPSGLAGCIGMSGNCPSMEHTSAPLILQEVPRMLAAGN